MSHCRAWEHPTARIGGYANLSGRHGMSPNALSRCESAVELLAWLPILVGHTARVVSFLECHPADSKRAQRADFV